MNSIEVIRQVAALPGMTIAELKKLWTDLHQTEPPAFNRTFLEKRLAYRLQEVAHGGLKRESEKRLERMAVSGVEPLQEPKRPPGEQLLPGTKLVREWKGEEHRCTVLSDGFEYQGRKFGSLSAVANFITGTKWNGFVFFGMKKQGDKQ
ncbi:MAG: DUF2924 domain-containing protein [Magnetococcales bacterium]|nr:DUF2924 domain-containing protein [Magnetococcales bacterium]